MSDQVATNSTEVDVAQAGQAKLTAVSYNRGARDLVRHLEQLADDRKLRTSRALSSDISYRIDEWIDRRTSFRAVASSNRRVDSNSPETADLLLTVEQIQDLADVFPVASSDLEEFADQYGFVFPFVSVKTTLEQTATGIYAAMFLFCVYFWANLRQSVRLQVFPARGTMFFLVTDSLVMELISAVLIYVPALVAFLLYLKPLDQNPIAFVFACMILALCTESHALLVSRTKWHWTNGNST